MPTQRPHISLIATLLLAFPLSCATEAHDGEVSDRQGCRSIVLPEPAAGDTSTSEASTTSPVPFCGDGVVDPGELCDNGEANGPGDLCNEDCRLNSCGDGELGAPSIEECDDGNLDSSDECTSGCKKARCGDGYVRVGLEECDDGEQNDDTAACTSACLVNRCGDGLVLAGVEECDDGNDVDDDGCTVTCALTTCGDGAINSPGGVLEECDDGNDVGNDGCSPSCEVERYRVFVTSKTYTGSFLPNISPHQGLDLADAHCQELADAAGLDGSYSAWLGDESSGPLDRFPFSPGFPGLFVRVDGAQLALGWDDVIDGTLDTPISVDEKKIAWNSGVVWTNTDDNGIPYGSLTCSDWLSSSGSYSGYRGSLQSSDKQWTFSGYTVCDKEAHLYCFQVTQ